MKLSPIIFAQRHFSYQWNVHRIVRFFLENQISIQQVETKWFPIEKKRPQNFLAFWCLNEVFGWRFPQLRQGCWPHQQNYRSDFVWHACHNLGKIKKNTQKKKIPRRGKRPNVTVRALVHHGISMRPTCQAKTRLETASRVETRPWPQSGRLAPRLYCTHETHLFWMINSC